MFYTNSASTDLYQRAIGQFLIDARFYFDDFIIYLNDTSNEERLLYLCAFIMFLIYVIVARARRKYNPGRIGRQIVGAFLVLGVVLFGGGALIESGGGSYSGIFQL